MARGVRPEVFDLSRWKNGPFTDIGKVEGQANLFSLSQ